MRVEMQNGCICSTLRDEFLAEIERLSSCACAMSAEGMLSPKGKRWLSVCDLVLTILVGV